MALAELSVVEQRYKAVLEAAAGVPVTEVAVRYGVSRQSVHAWIRRYADGGLGGLVDRPRRPDTCPHQVSAEVEAAVCELRREHPRWGPVRLVFELKRAGVTPVPSRMSAYRVLVRHGLIEPEPRKRPKSSYRRWERPAAATTIARKRAVFHGALNYAVELDLLPANPIGKVAWKAPEVADEIDRRVVASPDQARLLLAAVDELAPELTAFFGCLYYGCMRPGEAVILRQADCVDLPESGWGRLLLSGNAPRVGSQWTDSGSPHDRRHLKHRARKATRPVPIPPELVELLQAHTKRFGTTPDGRLFRGARGAILSESSYGRTWQRARGRALGPAQVSSPLAARPYDLRHSGVTLALNAGVPAPEVARRAGHGIAVLLRVYAGCIDGHEQLWNGRIDQALRDETAS